MNRRDITRTGTGPLLKIHRCQLVKTFLKVYMILHFNTRGIIGVELPHASRTGATSTRATRSGGTARRFPTKQHDTIEIRQFVPQILVHYNYLCLTVLPEPALGPAPPTAFGERLPAPTVVALAGADG